MRVLALLLALLAGFGSPKDRMVSVSTTSGVAYGCPVSKHYLVTSLHVPTDNFQHEPRGLVYSERNGNSGTLEFVGTPGFVDLALMKIRGEGEFSGPFAISKSAPARDGKVAVVGYSHDEDKYMDPVLYEGEVKATVAGFVYFKATTYPGSSGGCLISPEGEIQGINKGRVPAGEYKSLGVAVAFHAGAPMVTPKLLETLEADR